MSALGHVFNLIMTIIFFPWIIVWVGCAVSAGNRRKKKDEQLMERQTKALEELARIEKYRGWNNK